jgi:ubiquinone/menaquinone biosynthesis C-methylase UbiE
VISKVIGSPGKVIGLDRNPALLELAHRKLFSSDPEINWEEGVAEKPLFPDRCFDLMVIHYLSQ